MWQAKLRQFLHMPFIIPFVMPFIVLRNILHLPFILMHFHALHLCIAFSKLWQLWICPLRLFLSDFFPVAVILPMTNLKTGKMIRSIINLNSMTLLLCVWLSCIFDIYYNITLSALLNWPMKSANLKSLSCTTSVNYREHEKHAIYGHGLIPYIWNMWQSCVSCIYILAYNYS